MNSAVILGIIRHVLTGLGGAGVAAGWLTEGMLVEAVSAVVTLAGLVWSVIDKKQTAK